MKVLKNNTTFNKFHKNFAPIVNPKLPAKKSSRKGYLIKRIIVTNVLSLVVIALTYFWMIFLLSNVSSFWDIFRGKDIYVNQDNLPPIAPFLSNVPEATQSSSVNLTGQSEPGVKVELYVDGTRISETVSDASGIFTFANVPVGMFKQELYAKAVDESGNESSQSNTYTIQQDTTVPEFEITNPDEEEVTYRSTEHAYRIEGKGEPGVMVLVNNQLAVVNPNGEFFANLRLEVGGNSIKILVKDKALNETEKEIFINFEKID